MGDLSYSNHISGGTAPQSSSQYFSTRVCTSSVNIGFLDAIEHTFRCGCHTASWCLVRHARRSCCSTQKRIHNWNLFDQVYWQNLAVFYT